MTTSGQTFFDQAATPSEAPRTAGDVAKELGKSVTTIKALAVQTNAPIIKTPGGLWIFTRQSSRNFAPRFSDGSERRFDDETFDPISSHGA